VYNDFANSPNQKGLPEGHFPLRRFMSVPVLDQDRVAFIFGVGNKVRPYGDQDVIQLQLVASELRKILEARRAEQALRESEERYRLLFELESDAVFLLDAASLRFLAANQAACRLYGYSREEFLALRVPDISAEPEMTMQAIGQEVEVVPLRWHRRKDGTTFPVEITGRYFDLRDQRLHIAAVRDITERKRAEQALRESEQRYRTIVQTANEGILAVDPAYVVTYANHVMAEMLGCAEAEMLGRPFEEFLFPEDVPEHRAQVERRRRGEVSVYERRLRRKDGGRVWTFVSATPLLDAEGRFIGSFGMFTDITERRRAGQALRDSEERFRSLVETTSDWIWEIDAQGVYTYASPKVAELLGYRPDEVLGRTPFDLMPPEEAERVRAAFAPILEARGPFRGLENVNRRKDGSLVVLETGGVPVLDEAGEFRGYRGIDRDATERRRAEEALRSALAAMEAATWTKSQFLASMSHEIRTPLNGLIGMLQLLQTTELTPEQKEYADTARESGRGLLALVNDILDFSKMEAGKVELVEEDFDPRELVRALSNIFREQTARTGLRLAFEIAPDVPARLVADVGRLRQVLFNLVGNALKFTERGGVLVQARAEPLPDRPDRLRLVVSVSDTGVGIPPDKLAVVFEPFTQLGHGPVRRQGAGLGLTIVKGLVEILGGRVDIHSELGRGTTVRFFILAGLPGTDGRTAAPASETRSEYAARPSKGLSLLVVEDDRINRAAIAHMLAMLGHRATLAADGRAALDLLARERFDAVLMDIQMPGLDGVETTRRIRAGKGVLDPDVPIVAVTAHALPGDRERLLAAGISDYLAKPFEVEELIRALSRIAPRPPLAEPGP
jgi:PAS domain S-box-containing protein